MRFYHMADVHLGAEPDKGCAWSTLRRQEIWDTFREVLERAREEKPDCIFICGDLFHRQPLLRELKEVDYLFSGIPDTMIFLTAGNHDFLKEDSAFSQFSWSPNVYFFRAEEVTAIRIDRLNLTVYGHSYRSREITVPVYDELRPEEDTDAFGRGTGGSRGIHVLMAHGGDAGHIPMNYRKISSHGFDYVAMGHIHRPWIRDGRTMAYAGALEPLDVNDTGLHGYMEGSIVFHKETQSYRTKVDFVPAAKRSYIPLTMKLREDMTAFELEENIRRAMEAQGRQNLFRIILTGVRDPGLCLEWERIRRLGNVADIQDESIAAYDYNALKQYYKGQLIGRFLESYGEGELTAKQELSRRCGLEALLKTSGGKK